MKKFQALLILTMILALTGCGKGEKGDTGAAGPTGSAGPVGSPAPSPTVDPLQAEIDEIIADKNADRAILAQAPLTAGLSCTVQKVTAGQCLTWHASYTDTGCTSAPLQLTTSGTTYTYLYKGSFNQPNSGGSDPVMFLPASLRPIFQGVNFKIVCTGQIVVVDSNYYDFTLNSDDGSLLYLNGSLTINNDNNHGMLLKSGTALLYRGVQSFQLQYAQTGGGNYGLVLQSGGTAIDPMYFYH